MSSPVTTRFVRLRITAPEYTAWSGAARIYGFKCIGTNPDFVPPAPASIAQNAKIIQTPVLGDQNKFEIKLAADYDFYNSVNDVAPGTVTEGDTVVKWYKKLQDNYSTYYVSVPVKASGEITQTLDDIKIAQGYRCEITVYNSDGAKGTTVNVDAPVTNVVSLYENDILLTSLNAAKGKTVDITANFVTLPVQKGGVYVSAATYNDKGVLLGVKSLPVDISETGGVSCTIPDFTVSQDTAKMKVFFWASDTFIPLSEEFLVN
jgi:hypothetical protein